MRIVAERGNARIVDYGPAIPGKRYEVQVHAYVSEFDSDTLDEARAYFADLADASSAAATEDEVLEAIADEVST